MTRKAQELEGELLDLRKEIQKQTQELKQHRDKLPDAQAMLLGASRTAKDLVFRENITVRIFPDGSALWEEGFKEKGKTPLRYVIGVEEARQKWCARFKT
jgi:enamine deaminase RidA (YjgF/YER057c/UK114 family)